MPRCSRGTVAWLMCTIMAVTLLVLMHTIKRKVEEIHKTQRFVEYSSELEMLTRILEDLEKNSRTLEEDIILMHETALNRMESDVSPLEKPQENS